VSSLERPSIPQHVAIIMDGNGRWAAQRGLPRSAGHRQGVEAVRRAVRAAGDLGIRTLTIYSFSTENWSRPQTEVTFLLELMRRFIRQDVADLHAAGVRVRIIGNREMLDQTIVRMINDAETLTRNNTTVDLIVAFNYGARQEIARAAQTIARDVAEGRLSADKIDPALIGTYLDTAKLPDPDLLIRTGGEQRISNFLLWQCAYTEFVFVPEYWPDFNIEIMQRALNEFAGRDRRFGGIKSVTA
jgi:undecaprenyl diphosphate synthase